VGDFILTLPAIQLLKKGLPEPPEIEILGYASIAQVAVDYGIADSVRDIEYGSLAGFFAPGSKLDPELVDYFRDFDVVVSYLYDPDGHFEGNLERAGVQTLITGSHRVNESLGQPAAAHLAKPMEQIALFLEEPFVHLPMEETRAPRIALHPGSGSVSKNWGYENWVEVMKALKASHPDHEILMVSGEAERETIGEFRELMEKESLSFEHLEALPLPELAKRLAGCELFLGHDSGISHLAAAAGVPCVLVFGPTDPKVWAPQNPDVEVLRHSSLRLDQVIPAEVVATAKAMLSRG